VFAVGTVLAGKYRVDRVIGRGGMGVVISATHLNLQQPIALKLLHPEIVNNGSVVERFIREARASAQLRGEHVCRVSDVGAFDDGTPYIVMELLEGRDLASLVSTNGPIPVSIACDYVLQACLGVAEAHVLGIVHRDLKPANLFLTSRPDGSPLIKVLDFGIAKAQSDSNFSLTSTTTVLGSPGYMSPEQLRSTRDVDKRSDIWSLGVILYELVSGRPPFVAGSITELALRIAVDPAPPLVGRMPDGFEGVVMRCLGKEPEHRYPDLANLAHAIAAYGGPGAWELAHAVSRLLNVSPRRVPGASAAPYAPPVPPTMASTGDSPTTAASLRPSSPPTTMGSAASSMSTAQASGRRWGLIAAVALVVLVGTGVTLVAVSSSGKSASDGAAITTPAITTPATTPEPSTVPPPSEPTGSSAGADRGPPSSTVTEVVPPVADAVDAGIAPADAPAVAKDPRKRPPKRKPPRGSNSSSEDFSDSRF